jgi:hypothetical protein
MVQGNNYSMYCIHHESSLYMHTCCISITGLPAANTAHRSLHSSSLQHSTWSGGLTRAAMKATWEVIYICSLSSSFMANCRRWEPHHHHYYYRTTTRSPPILHGQIIYELSSHRVLSCLIFGLSHLTSSHLGGGLCSSYH